MTDSNVPVDGDKYNRPGGGHVEDAPNWPQVVWLDYQLISLVLNAWKQVAPIWNGSIHHPNEADAVVKNSKDDEDKRSGVLGHCGIECQDGQDVSHNPHQGKEGQKDSSEDTIQSGAQRGLQCAFWVKLLISGRQRWFRPNICFSLVQSWVLGSWSLDEEAAEEDEEGNPLHSWNETCMKHLWKDVAN